MTEYFGGFSPELFLVRDKVRVSFEGIGESLLGEDFDPEDGEDVEVLRFYVETHDPDGSEEHPWMEVEDASYCTQIRADSEDTDLRRLLLVIMNAVYDRVSRGESVKGICEELSWLPQEFAHHA